MWYLRLQLGPTDTMDTVLPNHIPTFTVDPSFVFSCIDDVIVRLIDTPVDLQILAT